MHRRQSVAPPSGLSPGRRSPAVDSAAQTPADVILVAYFSLVQAFSLTYSSKTPLAALAVAALCRHVGSVFMRPPLGVTMEYLTVLGPLAVVVLRCPLHWIKVLREREVNARSATCYGPGGGVRGSPSQ
jgi:hypothetical protein